MKRFKIYLSIFLVLSIMLCSTPAFAISTESLTEDDELIIESEENLGGDDELQATMARGCGYNLPDNFLNGGSWTDDYTHISSHLAIYHGVNPNVSSANLHKIKKKCGLTASYNCIFDYTGGVYNQNGEYMGSLITGI